MIVSSAGNAREKIRPGQPIPQLNMRKVASRKQISFRDQLLKAPLSSAEKQCGLHRHICLIAFHSRQVLWDRSCTLSDERIRARSILGGWVGVCGFSYARRWSLVYFVVTGERLRSKVA